MIITKRYIACPECNSAMSSVDHLYEENRNTSFGPCHCSKCGTEIRGEIKDGDLSVRKTGNIVKWQLILLRHCHIEDFYLVLVDFERTHDQHAYIYNNHTCPVNYLRVEHTIYQGDSDYHGLFEFVDAIPYQNTEFISKDCNYSGEDLLKLFNTIKN